MQNGPLLGKADVQKGISMNIEAAWYEGSPYIYAVVGLVSFSNYESYIAIISGAVLLAASATILRMRWTYRTVQAKQREIDERIKRIVQRKKQRKNPLENNSDEDF